MPDRIAHRRITIRPATPADTQALAALSALVFLHTYTDQGVDDEIARYVQTAFTPQAFAHWLAQAQQRLLVAVHDGRLVGMARLALEQPCPLSAQHRHELETLYVHPRFAGQGIGRALLAASRTIAGPLWLTVWDGNHAARGFYAAQNMQVLGETIFMLGTTPHGNLVLADG